MGIFGFLIKGTIRSSQNSAGNQEQILLIDKKIKQEEMIIEGAERTNQSIR